MKKELEAELVNVTGTAKPTRKIRSEQDKEAEPEAVSEVKSRFWEGVKATKLSERKEAVGELTKLASTKKISPGDFSEVCRTLKKLITDVNIAFAVEAIQAISNLALGLRTPFLQVLVFYCMFYLKN
ncbi:hypothetical protein K1719_002727 [Acacia pycnantha]|nr:hypothetical protein K1719_002727 [Acacia pycnantha]